VVEHLRQAFDAATQPQTLRVLLLPYAPYTPEFEKELAVVGEMGATVERIVVQDGAGEWPSFRRKCGFDQAFLDGVFFGIRALLLPAELPSLIFARVTEEVPSLLVAKNSIDEVDSVAEHRFEFFRRAVDALVAFVRLDGRLAKGLEHFFDQRGLTYASSGGIRAGWRIYRDGKLAKSSETHGHLKQGDATTGKAAVRLYFDHTRFDGMLVVVVLYAGPHPDSDVEREFHM
jgi:hypothetical protein